MSTATLNGPPPTSTAPSPFAGTATEGGGGGDYELCPAGNHPARLVCIFDLGTHDGEYQGQAKPDQRLLFLAWELPSVPMQNGDPFVIGESYTTYADSAGRLQFGEKNKLRLMLEGWRGRKYQASEPVDPGAVLGRPCLVNVIHKTTRKGNDIAVVEGVKAFPRGMQEPERHRDAVAYHVSMGHPPAIPWLPKVYHRESNTMEVLEDVAMFSKEMTGKPIGKGRPAPAPAARPLDDEDIPF